MRSIRKISLAGAVCALVACATMLAFGPRLNAQEGQRPVFRVKVDMVVLSFTITDSKGHYINGLKPKDFKILEDGITQKVATFAEGNKPPVQVSEDGTTKPLILESDATKAGSVEARTDAFVGTNVFVLFDTSNYMYRGFVYASDAIADFVLGLDRSESVAVYTYSRNLVAPDDVRAVAEDEGIPIYVISTNEVNKDPISSGVFKRISNRTGGKSYFAKTWQKQVEAFESIREDLGNSYTVTYYPQPNPNEGFRKIAIDITSDPGKKYRIQARPGYRPRGGF